jgi:hypothetical protein
MSDGCVATQASEWPSTATSRVAVLALARRAPRARPALVARLRHVLEVRAAGALEQVAADGRDVAQLPRGPGEHGLGEQWVPLAHAAVGGERAVGDAGADPQPAAGGLLDLRAEVAHVDEQPRRLDLELHQVDEIGAAGQVARAVGAAEQRDRTRGIRGPLVGERPHRAASAIAPTMFA